MMRTLRPGLEIHGRGNERSWSFQRQPGLGKDTDTPACIIDMGSSREKGQGVFQHVAQYPAGAWGSSWLPEEVRFELSCEDISTGPDGKRCQDSLFPAPPHCTPRRSGQQPLGLPGTFQEPVSQL